MPHAVVQGRKLYYELHGQHAGSPFVLAMGIGGSPLTKQYADGRDRQQAAVTNESS